MPADAGRTGTFQETSCRHEHSRSWTDPYDNSSLTKSYRVKLIEQALYLSSCSFSILLCSQTGKDLGRTRFFAVFAIQHTFPATHMLALRSIGRLASVVEFAIL
jgi:hypothetical protein